jgi:hypothetical protein
MNEAELVAETIATIKRDGWSPVFLATPDDGRHCILGAIGRARWGTQWDLDCNDPDGINEVYERLARDPLTRSLIDRIADVLIAKDDDSRCYADILEERKPAFDGDHEEQIVFTWNDTQHDEEDILEVLEKVQAEIG